MGDNNNTLLEQQHVTIQQVRYRGDESDDQKKALQKEKRQEIRTYNRSLTAADREELRRKANYTIHSVTTEELESKKAVTLKKQLLGSVSDAIHSVMPEAYKGMDAVRSGDDGNVEHTAELVHSKGMQLLESGDDVLEFDVGGSGFKEFRKEYKGFHGKSDTSATEREEEYGELVPGESHVHVKSKNKTLTVNDKEVTRNKTRYSIAGPLAMSGKLNLGDYSIANTRERIRDLSIAYLTPIFQEWETSTANNTVPDFHNITIMLRGHSRGGCGVSHGAMMTKYWLHENYPQYECYVKFNLIQYDPVPGGDSELGQAVVGNKMAIERFDHNQYDGVHQGPFEINGSKMMPLGDSANTTVVYSITNQDDFFHNKMFDPQEVLHAKRVILTPYNHDVGLDMEHMDTTQMEGQQKETVHANSYIDSSTGKVYRNSGLNDLPEGVYVLDENNVLVKVDSTAQLKEVMNRIMPAGHQETRQERIMNAATSVLEDKASEDDYSAINHARFRKLIRDIESDGSASSLRKKVKDSVMDLIKRLNQKVPANYGDFDEIEKLYEDAIDAATAYLSKRSGYKRTSNGKKRIKMMSQLHTGLKRELDFLRKRVRNDQRPLDREIIWDQMFSDPVVLNLGPQDREFKPDNYRIEKGGKVTLLRKCDEKDAKLAALVGTTVERFGESGLYQACQTAKYTDTEGNQHSGLIYEQIPSMTIAQAQAQYEGIRLTSDAKAKIEKIKAMDVLFNIQIRRLDPMNGIRAMVRRTDSGKRADRMTFEINDVTAEMPLMEISENTFAAELTAEEKGILKGLSSASKNMLRNLKPATITRTANETMNDAQLASLLTRLDAIKKFLK